MSQVIFKHPIYPGKNNLELFVGAKVLDVQAQNNRAVLWEMHDSEIDVREDRQFEFFGTGTEIPDIEEERVYVSTFQLFEGQYVFHVFENKL